MSGQQRSKIGRSSPTQAPLRTGDAIKDALWACVDTQNKLTHAQELSRQRQIERRAAIRAAFTAGASAADIAAAVHVSRTKIYQLIGSAPPVRS